MSGVALFGGGNAGGEREDRSNRCGPRSLRDNRAADRSSPGDWKEIWTLDGDTIRWLGVALFAAGGACPLASLCAQAPVQRVGRHPARAYAGHDWYLWRYPPPRAIWGCSSTRWGGPLRFRSSVGVLLTALLIPPLLARMRAEEALLRALWRRIRCVLHPHVAADSRALLTRTAPRSGLGRFC